MYWQMPAATISSVLLVVCAGKVQLVPGAFGRSVGSNKHGRFHRTQALHPSPSGTVSLVLCRIAIGCSKAGQGKPAVNQCSSLNPVLILTARNLLAEADGKAAGLLHCSSFGSCDGPGFLDHGDKSTPCARHCQILENGR